MISKLDTSFLTCESYLPNRDECYYSQGKGLSLRGCSKAKEACDCYDELKLVIERPVKVNKALDYLYTKNKSHFNNLLSYIEELEKNG
jgi:hypothetical protein